MSDVKKIDGDGHGGISKRVLCVKFNDCDDVTSRKFSNTQRIQSLRQVLFSLHAGRPRARRDAHAMTSLASTTERSILHYCWALGRHQATAKYFSTLTYNNSYNNAFFRL